MSWAGNPKLISCSILEVARGTGEFHIEFWPRIVNATWLNTMNDSSNPQKGVQYGPASLICLFALNYEKDQRRGVISPLNKGI